MTDDEKAAAIAAVKAELYQCHPFTLEWNIIARRLWALEDDETEAQRHKREVLQSKIGR